MGEGGGALPYMLSSETSSKHFVKGHTKSIPAALTRDSELPDVDAEAGAVGVLGLSSVGA